MRIRRSTKPADEEHMQGRKSVSEYVCVNILKIDFAPKIKIKIPDAPNVVVDEQRRRLYIMW